jgi:hypothetical protein
MALSADYDKFFKMLVKSLRCSQSNSRQEGRWRTQRARAGIAPKVCCGWIAAIGRPGNKTPVSTSDRSTPLRFLRLQHRPTCNGRPRLNLGAGWIALGQVGGQLDPRPCDRGAWDADARSSVPRSATQGSEADQAAAEQQEGSWFGHSEVENRHAAIQHTDLKSGVAGVRRECDL